MERRLEQVSLKPCIIVIVLCRSGFIITLHDCAAVYAPGSFRGPASAQSLSKAIITVAHLLDLGCIQGQRDTNHVEIMMRHPSADA